MASGFRSRLPDPPKRAAARPALTAADEGEWIPQVTPTERLAPMNAIRNQIAIEKFAWPGGYEMFAVTDDSAVLCFDCCRAESDSIDNAVPGDGWMVVGMDHTGNTDDPVTCDHCGRDIPRQ